MLQVENVFNLQIIGEGKDSQLNLKWITLDEKKNVEDYCEGCGTRDLREMIGGLVEKLVEEREIEPVLAVSNDENELKKQREEELRRKREDELRKQKEDEKRRLREIELNKKKEEKEELKRKEEEELKRKEEEELKRKEEEELKRKEEEELRKKEEELKRKEKEEIMKKFWIPYFKSRTLSFYGGACQTYLTTKQVVNNDNSSLNISGFKYNGFNIGTRYYLNENLFVSGYLCMGSPSEIEYVSVVVH